MTDKNTLADNNIKDFGKLSSNRKVSCYQYPTGEDSKSIAFCSDRVCLECGNDHTFRGNFEDAITSIDMLPAFFEGGYRSHFRIIEKLQEFVN